jgi:stage II sporulation protein AA (anti-sigma F factor antagonist)
MDSSGIGMLIGRYKRALLCGGRVAVCCLNTDLDKLFSLTGIKKIIPVFDSIEDAKKYLREVD